MRRTVNSTGRQRIERGDISLSLAGPEEGPRTFDLDLDLAEYDLPADARVYVEASRQTAWMRFDFGTVGAIQPPPARTLTDLGSAQGATFRVKVVEASPSPDASGGSAARILAQADNVPANGPDDDAPTQSMLHIDWDTEPRGEELWRVQIEDGAVVLFINKPLMCGQHWTALTQSPAFRTIALPAILRQILSYSLLVERDSEPSGAQGLWVKFARTTLGAGPPPDVGDEFDAAECTRWIDSAVTAFTRQRGLKAAAEQVFGGSEP